MSNDDSDDIKRQRSGFLGGLRGPVVKGPLIDAFDILTNPMEWAARRGAEIGKQIMERKCTCEHEFRAHEQLYEKLYKKEERGRRVTGGKCNTDGCSCALFVEAPRVEQVVEQEKQPVNEQASEKEKEKEKKEKEKEKEKFRVWQVGFEDEAFIVECERDECPTCAPGGPPPYMTTGHTIVIAFQRVDDAGVVRGDAEHRTMMCVRFGLAGWICRRSKDEEIASALEMAGSIKSGREKDLKVEYERSPKSPAGEP